MVLCLTRFRGGNDYADTGTWLLAHRLILQLRCAAPAISSESASEAASWIGCSAAAANGVHGPCRWYDASRLALRASWSSRWLAAPDRLHCKSSLCTDVLLCRCTRRSDGLSAHRSHPAFGARHLVSGCVSALWRRGESACVGCAVRRSGACKLRVTFH